MAIARFLSWVIRLGIILTLCGTLKACTLMMLSLASKKTEIGIMPYSKFSRMLTK